MFSVCANVNACNIESSLGAIKNEIDALCADGVTDDETEKAKMQLKVTALFGKENPIELHACAHAAARNSRHGLQS